MFTYAFIIFMFQIELRCLEEDLDCLDCSLKSDRSGVKCNIRIASSDPRELQSQPNSKIVQVKQ